MAVPFRHSGSELVALASRAHVRPEDPFDIGFLLLDRAVPDLVRPHLEARSDFGELDFLVRSLDKDVMPERDKVAVVDKRQGSFRVVFWYGEDEFEDIADSVTELGAETFEDEMGIRLRDGRPFQPSQTMPQHDSRQSEQDGRPVGEVTEHERVRDAAVLVHDDEVRHLVRAARVGQFGHDVVTAVDSGRIRDAEAQFFCKLLEFRRRVSRGGDQHSRVLDSSLGILVVNVGRRGVLGSIHLEFALAGSVAPRCLLALGEQVADCLLALPYLLLLLLERFRVQELAALDRKSVV